MITWVILYLVLGILTYIWLKEETKANKLTTTENIFTFLITVLLFPISIILLIKNKIKTEDLKVKHKLNLFNESIVLIKKYRKFGNLKEVDSSLNKSISDFLKGNFIYDIISGDILGTTEHFIVYGNEPASKLDKLEDQSYGCPAMFETIRVGWFFAMTNEFMKTVHNIDRKLQGRILEALEDLSKDPILLRGDTIKPLKGNLDGLWRYRIGDYRLVYQPDQKNKQIILHTFSSRGGVYE